MNEKRRTLVLTDETARHPFRMSLPPHVRTGAKAIALRPRVQGLNLDGWRGFLSAYVAAFVVVAIFIM